MAQIDKSRAKAQARWQLKTICKLVAAFNVARERTDFDFDVIENIHQHALETCVQGLVIPGCPFEATEYHIQLCWGGPAVRIIGELDSEEPRTARLEYQDWFTAWQELPTSAAETETMIEYARCFYFGS
jgi:hypothetical protein